MKFAKFTLSLLAVALLAVAPSSAFAGHGLLDGGCGCATQKGGHVVQKGAIFQKGPVVQHQKGGVHQKGDIIQKGGIAQKGCGSSKCGGCGSCSICLPNVLPALLNGIDAVLNKVFCCDSCGSAKGCGCATQKGHVAQKGYAVQKGHVTQKGSSCDCGTSYPSPDNPFVDDLQPPPIAPDSDADAQFRVRREVPRPVSLRTVQRPTRSEIKTASSPSREPRVFPAEIVSPMEKIGKVSASTQPKLSSIIRTSATTTSGLIVPKNPLR